jgi:hypothetical protein
VGVPDLLLTAIVFGFFFLGFVLGVFEIGRLGGIACLGITGGLAFGMRIMIIQEGLLFDADTLYAINWVIIAALGSAGGLSMIWWQRAGIVSLLKFQLKQNFEYTKHLYRLLHQHP